MSLAQISRILPLPEEDLQQALDYGSTLSKAEAAEHFKNLLGDSPDAIDFISSFNARRQDPTGASSSTQLRPTEAQDAVPKSKRGSKKKKQSHLHTPAPRQIANLELTGGTAYSKKDVDDYMPRRSGTSTPLNTGGPSRAPPTKTSTPPPRLPPSAAGSLISDITSKPKPRSTPASRSSTPGPAAKSTNTTKISIAGGTPMHGASTALSDLDAAIRALEITTNPALSSGGGVTADTAARRCGCIATRHPLLAAAPNCLSCGKVVCVREGLGPCTWCGAPLLSPGETQALLRELKDQRGREKMAADREAHRRPDANAAGRSSGAPFRIPRREADYPALAPPPEPTEQEARAAREHRDRLLGFQAQNARRTTVRDEAADFDAGDGGGYGGMWAGPEERARELRRQQKVLREMEWNALPEYEKRRQVISIDLVGGKVLRKMAAVERPASPELPPEPVGHDGGVLAERDGNKRAGGAFSRNPLLGALIKPTYDAKGKGAQLEGREAGRAKWRRVQDDLDDNEGVILDGGVYGDSASRAGTAGGDEPGCG